MGDIADMILEGTLDEETGEYIGEQNLERYGAESPGFPVSYERERREGIERKRHAPKGQLKVNCPICKKRVKVVGLVNHCRDVHGEV